MSCGHAELLYTTEPIGIPFPVPVLGCPTGYPSRAAWWLIPYPCHPKHGGKWPVQGVTVCLAGARGTLAIAVH